MSGEEIALISTLGSLGYLLIGWACVIVSAARWPKKKHRGTVAMYAWWWLLVLWPFIFPGLVVMGLITLGMWIYYFTLKPIKRLNPEIEDWGDMTNGYY